VLVQRPSFHGPALSADQESPRHDFCVVEIERPIGHGMARWDRELAPPIVARDRVALEYWRDDWRQAA
jgi:hypothetical protein